VGGIAIVVVEIAAAVVVLDCLSLLSAEWSDWEGSILKKEFLGCDFDFVDWKDWKWTPEVDKLLVVCVQVCEEKRERSLRILSRQNTQYGESGSNHQAHH